MTAITTITTPDQHEEALKRAEVLIGADPGPDTPEGTELDQLATVIEMYETNLFGPPPNPWRDLIEAQCRALGVPFDPFDPDLTLASLVVAHVRALSGGKHGE